MFSKPTTLILILALAALALAGCGGAPSAAGQAGNPTEIPPVISAVNIVAEGRLVPRESVELAFATNGQIAEVLVKEGEQVKAGDVIARLGNREKLEASTASAQMEILAAKEELLKGQEALRKLQDDLPDQQNAAFQALTDARQAARDAQRIYDGLKTQAKQVDIDAAWAQVVLAKDRLDKTRDDYEPYEKKSQDNVIRAALLARLAEAQRNYDNAVRKYNNMEGVIGNDFDLGQAESKLKIAQERLKLAQEKYDLLAKGSDPNELSLAQSRVETAQGRIASAEAALQAAQKALADLDLVATIDGSVVKNDLIAGQQVSAGTPVVQVADFSQWLVETDDLTELDVVKVAAGQKATLAFNALPDLELAGTVDRISDVFEVKRSDVTYTVRLLVNDPDPRLRWGMTVNVIFEK